MEAVINDKLFILYSCGNYEHPNCSLPKANICGKEICCSHCPERATKCQYFCDDLDREERLYIDVPSASCGLSYRQQRRRMFYKIQIDNIPEALQRG